MDMVNAQLFNEETEKKLFEFIRHGDEAYASWLSAALTAFRLGQPKPEYVASLMSKKQYNTKVVFIDGPNAVGKTYFTDHLEALYREQYPDKVIHKFDASKYTFWQGRKERVHHTDVYPEDELRRMYLGHIQMIRDIKKDIVTNHPDLILVNRSFMTFNAYNLRYDHLPPDSSDAVALCEMTDFFNENYENSFNTYLKDVDTLYVGLGILGDGVQIAYDRLVARDYVKRVDREHLTHLFTAYYNPRNGFKDMHTSFEMISSGGYRDIFNRYLS